MKKDKKPFREVLLQVIIELLLTLTIFGIGALIISLMGISLDSAYLDFETICLIGIFAPIILYIIIYATIKWIKKVFKKKTDDIKKS